MAAPRSPPSRARQRHACSSSAVKEKKTVQLLLLLQANDEAKFKAVIAPLEYEAGKALAGGGRESCLAAFFEKPLGFAICNVDDAAKFR